MADPVLTWTAVQEEHVLETGYIDKVHWDCSGTDGTYSARAYGDVPLEQPSDLVPYAEFNKQATLVAAVKDKLGAELIQQYEDAVKLAISEQKTPTRGGGGVPA